MRKTIRIVIAVVCILICIASGTFLLSYYLGLRRSAALIDAAKVQLAEPAAQQPEPEVPQTEPGEPSDPEQQRTVQIPIDFEAMHQINPEIYAWIQVPGTEIDDPVLQSETNDLYYNDHGADGKSFMLGAVFSQKTYNSRSFDDPMVLLYGHSTVVGQPGTFADLNSYADQAYFDAHRQIIIYTPEEMRVYTVYAACNYSHRHILHYHDFSDREQFDSFFAELRESGKDCDHFDPDAMPEFGDRMITLSTCYAPNKSQRYLICGVLTDVIPAEKND